jgi:DNA-binding CsgD family transcriptional regulator/predicted negative regulator of RcsB-dependent stress response
MQASLQAADLARAREYFSQARLGDADTVLRILLRDPNAPPETALLLARVEMRRGRPDVALSALASHAKRVVSREHRAEASLLRGAAFARLGDAESAHAQFSAAEKSLAKESPLRAELAYQIGAAYWIERRLDRAESALREAHEPADPELELQIAIVRGAIASARERLAEQGAILLQAIGKLTPGQTADVYLYGMIVTHVAALCVELPSNELRDTAISHIDRVPWTDDIGDLHFHALRAIAWRHALEGDEFNAFRRLRAALSATTSDAWRVAALADRAYLARALGELRWAAQELRDAHELAGKIDWRSVAGEEKLALPVLAELFASSDPAVAIAYAAMFARVGHEYPRVLSSSNDVRVRALEEYALGKVQLELGERDEALRLLTSAFEIYDRLGIQWRAGRAALALATIEDTEGWRERARAVLTNYPKSWLVRDESRGAPSRPEPAAIAQLTPAQRSVYDLLIQGRSTEDIADRLGRSEFTVRNHIKAIFKAFGVSSRPALIVKARQGGD